MYAIVDIAGQQFKVEKNKKIYVHRLENEEGTSVTLDKVLLIDNEGKVVIGAPTISGASISAKVVSHVKGDKVKVFKKKRRKGYKVLNGHRQFFTELLIENILEKGSPSKKDTEKTQQKTEPKKQEVETSKTKEKVEEQKEKTGPKKTESKKKEEVAKKPDKEENKDIPKKETTQATKQTNATKTDAPETKKKTGPKKETKQKTSPASKKEAPEKGGTKKTSEENKKEE